LETLPVDRSALRERDGPAGPILIQLGQQKIPIAGMMCHPEAAFIGETGIDSCRPIIMRRRQILK
jgi:hypothetical protein